MASHHSPQACKLTIYSSDGHSLTLFPTAFEYIIGFLDYVALFCNLPGPIHARIPEYTIYVYITVGTVSDPDLIFGEHTAGTEGDAQIV